MMSTEILTIRKEVRLKKSRIFHPLDLMLSRFSRALKMVLLIVSHKRFAKEKW
jgi:hypothetical protein